MRHRGLFARMLPILLAACSGRPAPLPDPPSDAAAGSPLPDGANAVSCACSCAVDARRITRGVCGVVGVLIEEHGVTVCRGQQTRGLCLPASVTTSGQANDWCARAVARQVEHELSLTLWPCPDPACAATTCDCVAPANAEGFAEAWRAEGCVGCAGVCLAP